MKYTNIRVTEEVRDALKSIGNKGETYNNVIERILEERKQDKQKNVENRQKTAKYEIVRFMKYILSINFEVIFHT